MIPEGSLADPCRQFDFVDEQLFAPARGGTPIVHEIVHLDPNLEPAARADLDSRKSWPEDLNLRPLVPNYIRAAYLVGSSWFWSM